MKTRKLYLITLFLIMGTITASAQGHLEAHLQFKTMHYWRGLRVSKAPVFAASAGYFSKNFSAFVWSGVSLTGDYKEVDPVISCTIKKNFSITLLDINNFSGLTSTSIKFFNYNKSNTNTILDLSAAYKVSFLDISWATIIYGNDRVTGTSNQRFSTYVELGVPIKTKFASFRPFIASAFALNSNVESVLYSNKKGFNIVNVGFDVSKTIKVKNYNLPITATVGVNPALNQASFQLAVNLF